MVAFLSDEWFERVQECRAGWLRTVPDVSVQIDVAGSPTGVRVWHVSFADGAVAECAAGPAAPAGVSLSLSWSDAVAILRGTSSANAAFMQGRIKTEGATGPLLALLSALGRPEGSADRDALCADTDV